MFVVMVSAALALQGGAVAAPVTLHFKSASPMVDVKTVLGDIVEIESADARVREHLNDLPLGALPMPGRRVSVDADSVETVIRIRFPELANLLNWTGPSSATFFRPAISRPLPEIASEASKTLEEWLKSRYLRFEMTPVDASAVQIMTSAAANLSYEVRSIVATKRMAVWATIHEPGIPDRALPVWFKVNAFAESWVAGSPLLAGADVSAAMFHPEVVDVTEHPDAVPNSFGFDGTIAIGPIEVGSLITTRMLVAKPIVVAGDRVRIRVRQGSVQIETIGVAEQSGDLGQRVRMRNSSSGDSLSAKVIAAGLVEALP